MPRNYISIDALNVALDFGKNPVRVGKLATKNRKVYFEYNAEFLKSKLELSPFHLPLQSGVHTFDAGLFEGLPGIFSDSLPDGWGRLLLDRTLRTHGIMPDEFAPLDRLAHVGKHGMGALIYEPDYSSATTEAQIDLDTLSEQSQQILAGESSDVLEELLALNGSSAGARPKAMIGVNKDKTQIIRGIGPLEKEYEPWLVKFSNSADTPDAGAIEFVYSQMARRAELDMTDTHLFPAKKTVGYFATRRFDLLPDGKRLHMHTACGLLHSDFRVPSLDYQDLIKATMALTRDIREAQKMYRLAVFNVLSYNRDDHTKNFSYLMDESGQWRLAPAYDLTFSSGPGGEQSTMVMEEKKNPCIEHLLKLAPLADLSTEEAHAIIEKTREALSQWDTLAKEAGVTAQMRKTVAEKLT
ncbi:MAG: type II toxin-antitoxin system HipA family toxin [Alphaproteobacteria bacterium]|nr:type II toxin-antitoxin system HipA family toxin [Alphaproteobacteria bacterium]